MFEVPKDVVKHDKRIRAFQALEVETGILSLLDSQKHINNIRTLLYPISRTKDQGMYVLHIDEDSDDE